MPSFGFLRIHRKHIASGCGCLTIHHADPCYTTGHPVVCSMAALHILADSHSNGTLSCPNSTARTMSGRPNVVWGGGARTTEPGQLSQLKNWVRRRPLCLRAKTRQPGSSAITWRHTTYADSMPFLADRAICPSRVDYTPLRSRSVHRGS
jgi:hypothetical protein